MKINIPLDTSSLEGLTLLNTLNTYWQLLGHEKLGYTEIRIKRNLDHIVNNTFIDNYEDFKNIILNVTNKDTADIFISANPRGKKSGFSKDVSYLTNIVLDLDDLSSDFTLPESLVKFGYQINSGRGIHIYIPIIPISINNENRNNLQLKLKCIKDSYKKMLIGKAKVDNVHDLARVMRCPGTINTKNGKLVELVINKPIERLHFDLIYNSVFDTNYIKYGITFNIIDIKHIVDKDIKLQEILYKNKYPSTSEKVFAITKYIIPFGYSKDIILNIIDLIKDKDKNYSQDVDRIISKVYNEMELKSLNLCINHYQENLDKREIGFFTGIKYLDEKTGGFMRKELVVIGARSSIGKTTFVMNLVLEFLERDLKVLMFPTEMGFTPLIDKLVSMKCKIPLYKFRKNQIGKEEINRFEKIKEEFSGYKFLVSENASPKLHEIEYLVNKIKPDVIVLDYVQRVSTQMPDRRNMELEMFVRGMKNLAKANNCCAVLTSQLNRLGDEKEPDIKALRDTDTLEHEGDLVLLLGTDNKLEQNRVLNLYISKNRYGELGYIALTFDTVFGTIG